MPYEIIAAICSNKIVNAAATKLNETIFKRIGFGMKLKHEDEMNKVKARAPVYKAQAKYEIEDMEAEQALKRLDHEERIRLRTEEIESRRQHNLESIVAQSYQAIPDDVSEDPVDPDWVFKFIDACQDVGDEEMQSLWAQILAGEITKPGSYSARTLQLVRTLSKHEAEVFVRFCSCLWSIDSSEKQYPIVPTPNIYSAVPGINIDYDALQMLDDIGLIRFDALAGVSKIFGFKNPSPNIRVGSLSLTFRYFRTPHLFRYKEDQCPLEKDVNIGHAILRGYPVMMSWFLWYLNGIAGLERSGFKNLSMR
ncbi:DUF2806 domain-containing protein [Paludisphaera borealis]|uniref:DUF2806 domain-containing protein n=1 Tax=Paludisphaera borealis TaxID=1387353 RepID=A0A1U7CN15_9BACT|nr:DUF2806 domain-containing protein [Paludisphaera borealis]APW60330.1 hypothetical protein BSF38_01798 [Paludisphaera borealis]